MLLVDTVGGRLIGDDELKESYAHRQPYGEWLDQSLVYLKELSIPNKGVASHTQEQRDRLYKAFGYTYEDVKNAILPMARNGSEPTSAMGIDIPLAVLSENHQPLFNYFKQLFAQVTNPPIDAIREKVVTDTTVYVGSGGNLLREGQDNCRALQIDNPDSDQRGPAEDQEHESAWLPGGDRLHALLQEHPAEAGPGPALCGLWTRPTATGPTSSSSPTGGWTKTMWPSRPCWPSPPLRTT